MNRRILVVEDDPTTADYLALNLREAGYAVDVAADGDSGLAEAGQGGHAAIIIDRMLPGMDGLTLLSTLRERGLAVPAIILSALGSTDERVRGLQAGSDDYLVKPFALSELLARLDAVQRRAPTGAPPTAIRLTCADLAIDVIAQQAERAGQPIPLKPREWRLLEFLMRNQGNAVTRSMILEQVWQYDFDPGTNVIDVHISNLRKKIDRPGLTPLLHTVRGIGYRLGGPA